MGYACRRFPQLGLSVIGGRPFSRGGTDWKIVAGGHVCRGEWGGRAGHTMWLLCRLHGAVHPTLRPTVGAAPVPTRLTITPGCTPACTACTADFYDEQYGISGFQDSAHRILDLALQAQPEDLKVGWLPGCLALGAAQCSAYCTAGGVLGNSAQCRAGLGWQGAVQDAGRGCAAMGAARHQSSQLIARHPTSIHSHPPAPLLCRWWWRTMGPRGWAPAATPSVVSIGLSHPPTLGTQTCR